MLDLGKRLRELRKKRKYSARELSERSGVARSLISQIETGKRQSTSMDTVYRLAKALDTPISSLLSEDPRSVSAVSYRNGNEASRVIVNEADLPYLPSLQKAQEAGLTPALLDEFIDLLLRIRKDA